MIKNIAILVMASAIIFFAGMVVGNDSGEVIEDNYTVQRLMVAKI